MRNAQADPGLNFAQSPLMLGFFFRGKAHIFVVSASYFIYNLKIFHENQSIEKIIATNPSQLLR